VMVIAGVSATDNPIDPVAKFARAPAGRAAPLQPPWL
jgi:hypothetical protein